jgi:hypothetical protein
MVSEVNAPGLGGGPSKPQALCRERIPVCRLNAYLWPRRSGATCGNGRPHSGYRIQPMRPEVQVLPGPPLALTSATAG